MVNRRKDESDSLQVIVIFFSLNGGMTQYSTQIANAVIDYVEVTVIAPESDELRKLLDEESRFHPLSSPELSGPIGTVLAGTLALISISRCIRQQEPDLIHVPFLAGIPSIVTLPILWLHRVPIIGTIHDPVSHTGQEMNFLNIDLRVAILTQVTRLLNIIIVHGEYSKQQALSAGYAGDKIRVLPHGLYDHFNSADDGQPAAIDNDNILLFFGKIRPNKGFDRIPEIVDGVAESVSDVTAVVAGSADVGWQIDHDKINQIIENLQSHEMVNLDNRYIPNDEVGRYFSAASLVVLPYYDATASGVAMIAYTFDTPIVATRTGEMGRMIERDNTGILTNPESTDDIVEAVIKMLTDQELQQNFKENIRTCKGEYAWSTIGEQTIELYREAVQG